MAANDIITTKENHNKESYENSSSLKEEGGYFEIGRVKASGDDEPEIRFEFSESDLKASKEFFQSYCEFHNTTIINSINAIRNLLRKENYSELFSELIDGEISQEEYEKRIDDYPDKYVVQLRKLHSDLDLKTIFWLIDKIGSDIRDLTVSEVGELFSLEPNEIAKHGVFLSISK